MEALRAALWLAPARLRARWRMLLVAGAGVLAASLLLAAAPVYAGAMADLGLQFRLDRALGEDRVQSVTVEGLLATEQDLARRNAVDAVTAARLGWLGAESVAVDRSERFTLQLGEERPGEPPDWAAFVHAVGDLARHVEVVEGRLPDPAATVPEVALPDGFQRHVPLDTTLAVRGGSFDDCQRRPMSEDPEEARAEVQCRPTTRLSQAFTVRVAGFVRARDPGSPVWELSGASLEVPEQPLYAAGTGLSDRDRAQAAAGVGSMPLLVSDGALAGSLAAAAPLTAWRHRVGVAVEPSRLRTTDVDRALREAAALRTDVDQRLGLTAAYDVPLVPVLQEFRTSLTFNQVPLLIILLQVTGIVLYYLVIVSQMLVDREAEELGVLGSRGATAGQAAGLHLVEALALAVPAALLAPWLATAAVGLLGRTPTFAGMTEGGPLPVSVTPLAYLLALGGALLAVGAMVLPAAVRARRTIVEAKAEQARPSRRSALQRYYLDLAVVGLAALLFWELRRRGTVYAAASSAGWSADPLLLAAPFVFSLAAAALVLRFYPPLLRSAAAVLLLGRGTAVALGLRRAARSPATYARLVLLLVLAVAVGTFAASYGPTVQESREDRVRYEAGSDLRQALTGMPGVDVEREVEAVRDIEGVAGAALATRAFVATPDGGSFSLLGIDADRAASMLWFRDDFADESLEALTRRLRSTVPPGGGLELPPDAAAIEVSVFGDEMRTQSLVWARLRDGSGSYVNLALGGSPHEGWRTLSTAIPEGLPRPLYFNGLLITDARGVGVQRQGSLFFDDLEVVAEGGVRILLDDFEGRFGWLHFGGARTEEQFERSEDRARSGRASMRWQWAPGLTEGRRLLAINAGNVPLSAVFSESAARALGVRPGDVVTLHLDGVRVPFAVRAVARLFPTLEPEPGFVVVNRADLQALTALIEVPSARGPDELWVDFAAETGSQRDTALEAVRARLGPALISSRATDVAAGIEAVRADPTLQASGSGILGAAFAAVLGLAILGFLVSVATGASARTVEMAVLRAIGSSRAVLLRSMALEWGTVLALGLAIGVLLGRRIAGVMLAFLDVTETGSRVTPPFVVQTDWVAVGLAGLVLVAALGTGVVLAWRASMRRADARQLRLTQ